MNNKPNNMPGFAVEASLYKTRGHYRTGRRVINLPAQMMGTIHLSAADQETLGEEVIPIFDPWPPTPWNPPDWSGHGGTGAPGWRPDREPSDGEGSYAVCRARCFATKHGAALRACLEDC